ncbi:anti-phage-associated DUF3780 domain-containing protein [Caldimonas tepidiphila]|uniref:anti-phage-associated DUF3780 domain-containing protein n=1 Tax=Caldimonas tepidiphila TaxID=2315841 RepID=UPI000E5BC8C8|nr:anti-phage-associated DUF3780 domain-containing protein [Caldimonas tepidiphila]
MSKPDNVKPAALVEGFGVAAFGAHIFRVEIPAAAKGNVTIIEDYGLKGGENGIPPREPRVVLPRRFWSAIAETARKDFVTRLKAKKLAAPRWTVGDNKVDRMLGKELCVLAWAAEQANSVDECKGIAAKWAALKPEERWWLFRQTVADAGLPDDKDAGWRKALYFALSSAKTGDKKSRSIRPPEDGQTTLQMF